MPETDYTPSLEDVAAIIPTRTADDVGDLKETFDDETAPTAAQVTRLINGAVRKLAPKLGENLPAGSDELIPAAKNLAALLSAMSVELTYFPRQVGSGESPYRQLKEKYDEDLKDLMLEIEQAGGSTDEETGESVGETMSPSYGFPRDEGGLVGWRTNW
jgi:hypothetical protein